LKLVIEHNAAQVQHAFEQAPKLITAALDRALSRGVIELARAARRKAPEGFGQLRQSILHRRVGEATYEVVAGTEYARHVEEGAGRGGWPTQQRMIDWIRRKGIQPRDPDMTLEDLALVMRRSIARRGTPAQPFMAPALEESRDRLTALLNQEIGDALERIGSAA